jgi:prephenate dehydrogenase
MKFERLGLVGYGEVGKIFAAGLRAHVGAVSAWDVKFDSPVLGDAQRGHAAQAGVLAQYFPNQV